MSSSVKTETITQARADNLTLNLRTQIGELFHRLHLTNLFESPMLQDFESEIAQMKDSDKSYALGWFYHAHLLKNDPYAIDSVLEIFEEVLSHLLPRGTSLETFLDEMQKREQDRRVQEAARQALERKTKATEDKLDNILTQLNSTREVLIAHIQSRTLVREALSAELNPLETLGETLASRLEISNANLNKLIEKHKEILDEGLNLDTEEKS